MTTAESDAWARGSERRLHTRQRVLLSCLRLTDSNGGIVLNVSERGLALRAARTLANDDFRQVRFQLSQSDTWVETRARIAWISASRTTAGIEFVDLSTEGRTLLAQWISSIVDANAAARRERSFANITVAQPSVPSVDATDRVSSAKPAEEDDFVSESSQGLDIPKAAFGARSTDSGTDLRPERSEEVEPPTKLPRLRGFRQEAITPTAVTYRRNTFRLPIILFVSSALLAVGFVDLALLRNERVGGKKAGNATTARRLAVPADGPSFAPGSTPPQRSSSVPATSKKASGFVLQAGAMRREENAYALARSLQEKGFPAFTFTSKTEHFYGVFVGPYPYPSVAGKAKKELQDQGFTTVVRRWPL